MSPEQKKKKTRTVTPFLDGARKGDEHQELLLRIALSHGITDQSQVKDESESALPDHGTPSFSAKARALLHALQKGSENSEEDTIKAMTTNPRVSQWMPGGKKSRVAKNKSQT